MPSFLTGGGEMAARIAAHDWSPSLGPLDAWPQSLKTTVALMVHSPVPLVLLWGSDGIMLYNDAYSGFAGNRHPALLGSKVREGWPEVADFNDNVMKVGLAGGTLQYKDAELALNRRGGLEPAWLDLFYSPVIDESGTPGGVIAVVIETTERVLAERATFAQRERLAQMFQNAPSFMAQLDGPTHVFAFANPAYGQLIGHRNVIGKPIREALPDIAGQGFFELLDQLYASGQSHRGEGTSVMLQRALDQPLQERLVDFIFQPVRNSAGTVTGIFVEGIDVTESHGAVAALRESEAQFRTMAQAMPNHVWTAKADGLLDWLNDRTYDYAGAQPGTLRGNAWTAIVHPDDIAAAAAQWGAALAAGHPYEAEFRLRRHDDLWRWHIARATPIRDAAGAVSRWVGTNTDIQDQKEIAAALENLAATLEQRVQERTSQLQCPAPFEMVLPEVWF